MLLASDHWTRTTSTSHSRRRGKASLLQLCQTLGKPKPVPKQKPAWDLGFKGVSRQYKTVVSERSELYSSFLEVLTNPSLPKPRRCLDTRDEPRYNYRRHDPIRYFTASQPRRIRHRRVLTAQEIAIQALKTRQQRCSLDMDQQISQACCDFQVDPMSVPDNVALLRDSSLRLRNAFKQI